MINEVTHVHASDEWSQQQQKGYKAGEEVVDSLTSEESINVFLARQKLRFVKENLNKQEMKDSMFLELNIAAHNIDGITSVLSIQKLHNLLEFINENSIDIMAISETNIDY
ncbi:unnamed protein product [Rhizophagus irregularis]|nr:unnamed protein product [Rhizophagus irregularis]